MKLTIVKNTMKKKYPKMLKMFDQNNYQQVMAATRFEHVQEEYTKSHTSYNVPSQFTGGYVKAISYIEMSNYDNHDTFQGYKYANTVIDEEIGRVMEYLNLLKDERYKETRSRAG